MEARASPGSKFNRLSLPLFPPLVRPPPPVFLFHLSRPCSGLSFRPLCGPVHLRPSPSLSWPEHLLRNHLPGFRTCLSVHAFADLHLETLDCPSVRPFHAFLPLSVIPTKRALRFAWFPRSRPRKFCPCMKLVRVAVPPPLFKLYCSFSLPLSLYNVSDFLPVCPSACYFPYISPLELTFSPFCYLYTFRRFIALFSLLRWKFLSLFLPLAALILLISAVEAPTWYATFV